MASTTRNGVAYDLEASPYMAEYLGHTFLFSSDLHRRNFVAKAQMKREWLNDSLSRRFKCIIKADLLAVLQLYTQIETRGFCVYDEEGWKLDIAKQTFSFVTVD